MDSYGRKTQLPPVALALTPVTVVLVTFFRAQSLDELIGSTGLLMFTAAAHIIVARLVRDRGNIVQERLWKAWGGNPAVQKLRWRGAEEATVSRLHRRVEAMTGVPLPNRAEEEANPNAAEGIYEDAVARMRELTRDHGRYPRVYAELVQYGVTRNLYGLKPTGLVIAGSVLFAAIIMATLNALGVTTITWWSVVASALGSTAVSLVWLFIVTSQSVRLPADRYADALLSTAGEPNSQPRSATP